MIFGIAIEYDQYIGPFIPIGVAADGVGYQIRVPGLQKAQVLLNLALRRHPESRVGFAQRDQPFDVVVYPGVLGLARPIDLVDAVRGFIGVFHPVLCPQELRAGVQEADALGAKHGGQC